MYTSALGIALLIASAPADPKPIDVKPNVAKGLKWLAEQQQSDGRWVGRADSQPTTTTATAGLAFLMEGSTLRSGAYAPNLRKAVAWMEGLSHPNGLICAEHRTDAIRPIPAHAQALLFLACAYDVDDDPARRKRLAGVLEKAVEYSAEAQNARGAWYFTAEGARTTDDPLTTADMLHALLAARKVGIDVPRKVTDKATDYLVKAAEPAGRLVRPDAGLVAVRRLPSQSTTTAAAAALLGSDGPRPAALDKWIEDFQGASIQRWPRQAVGNAAVAQLHAARLAYALGDGGPRRAGSGERQRAADALTWSRYRAAVFPSIVEAQAADGSWRETIPGPVYGSAVALVILQLENDYAAAFAR